MLIINAWAVFHARLPNSVWVEPDIIIIVDIGASNTFMKLYNKVQ